MRTLYLECNSGISGDMTVAALLDLGANRGKLEEIINAMNLGCTLHFGRRAKNSVDAYDFDVILPEEHEHHHHHEHHHEHTHEHHHHNHEHRSLKEITPIIDNSLLPDDAKALAHKMFDIVAEAESKVHGLPKDEVHFHEVGAVDSIVDICAVAFCITDLGIDRVISSPVSEGTGEIRCQHGIIPVPVPATLEITKAHSIPLTIKDVKGEMVTPTGAAIVAALADSFERPQNMTPAKIGYGAGKKDFPHANILRAFLFDTSTDALRDEIIVLETNVDDSAAEELGYCLQKLFDAGVKDAFFTPIYMKKGRPAYSLTVMCKPDVENEAVRLIFTHTSSVGLRRRVLDRIIMDREKVEVETPYGTVKANKFSYGDFSKISLEYDSVKALADEQNISISKIYRGYTEK